MLGDFVFQTRAMARNKHSSPLMLFRHAIVLTLCQAAVALPIFWSWPGLWLVLGVGLSHLGVDGLRGIVETKWPRALAWFVLDQAAHIVVLVGAWLVWTRLADLSTVPQSWIEPLGKAAVVVTAYAFNMNAGAALVGGILRRYELDERLLGDEDGRRTADREVAGRDKLAMGRMIGILERMILLTLVLVEQWGAVGFVLAAKSIARFRELDDRAFSEYYLIGTLASVLVAVGSGLAVQVFLNS
jgi:hypothetical protein